MPQTSLRADILRVLDNLFEFYATVLVADSLTSVSDDLEW